LIPNFDKLFNITKKEIEILHTDEKGDGKAKGWKNRGNYLYHLRYSAVSAGNSFVFRGLT
jgi:hypothetical protein